VAGPSNYPTILVVDDNKEFRDMFCQTFQGKGYFVLEAENGEEALKVVVRQSRHIHLLLANDSDDSRIMAATLKLYRLDMHIIHIRRDLDPGLILMEVSKIVEPPAAFEDTESARDKVRAVLTKKLEAARRRYVEFSRAFLDVTKGVPSGLPHPDGLMMIERSANARRRAFDEYIEALKKVEDHLAAADTRIKPKYDKKREK
jgi:CheY-like chemotaxis protein